MSGHGIAGTVAELLQQERTRAALLRRPELRQLIRDTQVALRVLMTGGRGFRAITWCASLYSAVAVAVDEESVLIEQAHEVRRGLLGQSDGGRSPEIGSFNRLLARACEVHPEAAKELIELLAKEAPP